ncbi:MAG: hypothetical protein JSW39_03775 [Desulfobacterales bacterium]|nr:MAG: hypothetical protein JSW39_03775 [Desulfobacterales bacterium]
MNFILTIIGLYVCLPLFAFADTVLLKDGKPIETDRAWRERDRVFFDLHGLEFSVPQKDVIRIERKKLAPDPNLPRPKEPGIPVTTTKRRPPEEVKRSDQHPATPPVSAPNKAGETANLIPHNGFRDLRWGIEVGRVDGLVEIDSDAGWDGVIEYIRPDEHLKMGEARLRSIVYAFWRNRLYTITIWTQGHANYTALRHEVFKHIGRGHRSDQSRERYVWSDNSSDKMLEFIENGQTGMLWMRSKELDRLYKLSELRVPSSYLNAMRGRAPIEVITRPRHTAP